MPGKIPEVTLILFGTTVVILLLIATVVFALFVNQKRKFVYRQQTLALKTSFEQELLKSQLEIQSQSIESISRELHDNVGTIISIAMVHLRSIPANETGKFSSVLAEADNLLNEAMDTLRDISRSMHPENINRLGWQNSFVQELERIRRTNKFKVEYTTTGEPVDIELHKQVIIFRILQESLNNVIKHSAGSFIKASIGFEGNGFLAVIEDDGNIDTASLQPGSGIRNMQARAAMLPAQLTIEKFAQKGVRVTLRYPVSTKTVNP